MTARPRFLVFRGGAIGDFILTLPAIQALRETWPDAHIELIGYPHIAKLGLPGGTLNAVDSLDRAGIARLYSLRDPLDEDLRARVRSFDLVLSYLHDPPGGIREKLESTGVAQVLATSPVDPPEHAADHLARPLESLAIYAAGRAPVLAPPPPEAFRAGQWFVERGMDPRKVVCLHPGSGSPRKNWPADRFCALAEQLAAQGFQPVFTFGEADDDTAKRIPSATPGRQVAMDSPDLCDLAARLALVRGFVGNDSGISHLAAAAGTACIALFGPTDPDRWAPRGPRVTVLRADDGRIESLGVDRVEQAARERFALPH